MDRPLVVCVLAGGIGSRLYPASRSHRPKQFLSLDGDASLLQRTVNRADFADHVVVSTRESFASEVRELVPGVDVVTEPAGKDTGPALVYATHEIATRYDDPVVVTLPSDHHVEGDVAPSLRTGARVASETGSLVAFGVEPTRPDTGYGYIEPGADRGDYRLLDSFHEKPDGDTARRYVDRGYLWNAGIFAWTADSLLAAARDSPLAPLVEALEAGDAGAGFAAVDAVSIDNAVMERVAGGEEGTNGVGGEEGTNGVGGAVVPLDVAWDDLGSWDALERLLPRDGDGNAVLGEALTVDAGDNVVATDDHHVSLVGVSDLAVVAWDDRVLVVPKDEAQRVRDVVSRLKEGERF